mmetsp:Transcript_14882/g.1347  ORF Transcript_14882/g.1347 Transcript_14882/m.1347 type:complete len:103 (-) Transcript_14882:24-332(-)
MKTLLLFLILHNYQLILYQHLKLYLIFICIFPQFFMINHLIYLQHYLLIPLILLNFLTPLNHLNLLIQVILVIHLIILLNQVIQVIRVNLLVQTFYSFFCLL